MEKNLQVGYKSEWDPDATSSNNDCGPTALATVINFLGDTPVTTDQVSIAAEAGKGLVTIAQLVTAADKLGYTLTNEENCTLERIKQLIDQGVPPIVLVHYGSLTSTQDKVFKGGHFMPVVGYRADDSLYVNDPNFKGTEREQGDHHVYTKDEFMKAWSDATLDGNKPFGLLVVTPKQTTVEDIPVLHPYNLKITATGILRVRTSPKVNATNIVMERGLQTGDKFTAEGFVVGDEVKGNDLWWKFKGEDLYTWSGGTNAIPSLQDTPVGVDLGVRNTQLEEGITKIQAIIDGLNVGSKEPFNLKTLVNNLLRKN